MGKETVKQLWLSLVYKLVTNKHTKNNIVNDYLNKAIDHSKNLWQTKPCGLYLSYGFNSTKVLFTDGLIYRWVECNNSNN